MTPDQAVSYLAGAVLLGAAPCTAMVFVWSKLTKGDGAYTLVQVASNDLIIQTFLIFGIAFTAAYLAKLPYNIAAPCGMIGASNFFELAVAVTISLFGLSSGATLATVVGVLVEVPVMLVLVTIANSLQENFR